MTWFKVDDSFHSHPKVLAAEPAALGLWVVAGTWCSANLTDGVVPDYALPRLLPDAARLAELLVACRLWKRTKGGYRFHDWDHYNPTAESVKSERAAARERMRAVRAKRNKTNETPGQTEDGSGEHDPNVRKNFGRSSATPTRPDPTSSSAVAELPVGARKRSTPTRVPEDFAPDEKLLIWAKEHTPDVIAAIETPQFIDHWRAKSGKDAIKADWDATWRNWMRNAQKWTGERNGRPALSVVGRTPHQPYRENEDHRDDVEYWSKGL